MKVLVVAEEALAASLIMMMAGAKMKGWSTNDVEEAISLATVYDYDAVVMEVPRRGAVGIKRLRAAGAKQPILALSGDADHDGRAEMLYAGADAALQRPAHKVEVMAVLTALIRRAQGIAGGAVDIGPGVFSLGSKTLSVGGRNIHMTPKEADILDLLVRRRESLVTRDALMSALYGGMDEPEIKVVDVLICKLRKKMRAALGAEYVDTVWGRGYVLRQKPVEPKIVGESPYAGRRGKRLDSLRGRVLAAAETHGSAVSVSQLARATGLEGTEIQNALSPMLTRGLMRRDGPRGVGVYTVTESGKEWLDVAGFYLKNEDNGPAGAEPVGEYQET